MSTDQASLKDALNLTVSGGLSAFRWGSGVAILRESFGIQQPTEAAKTTAATAPTVLDYQLQEYQSILPLKGMFADDPAWDDLPAFLENYWREMDETPETD